MAIETASYIGELNSSNPDGAVSRVNELDNHIRLIKQVLKTQFPNLGNAAVSRTAAQIDSSYLAANTKQVFYNPLLPTGWTEVSSPQVGSALRVVAAGGGSTGGSAGNPSGQDMSATIGLQHTHAFSLQADSAGSHNHTGVTGAPSATTGAMAAGPNAVVTTDHNHVIVSGGAHIHTVSGTVSNALGNFNFKYMDVIVGNKDV